MPKLVKLYIRNVLIGFAISGAFVAGLMAFDVAGLWSLIKGSDMGWIALVMLFMANGIVFAGVQFAIVVNNMAEHDDQSGGGTRSPELALTPAPVAVRAREERRLPANAPRVPRK